MDISVYSIDTISNSDIERMLRSKKSFVIEDISRTNMSETVETVEKMIEGMGLRCRVYTKGRSAALLTWQFNRAINQLLAA